MHLIGHILAAVLAIFIILMLVAVPIFVMIAFLMIVKMWKSGVETVVQNTKTIDLRRTDEEVIETPEERILRAAHGQRLPSNVAALVKLRIEQEASKHASNK